MCFKSSIIRYYNLVIGSYETNYLNRHNTTKYDKLLQRGNQKMKEITDIKEMQNIELDILKFVDKVCKDNNINYFISDGTLIGAIRHKGFIPWDDDVDITMLRADYEKFLKIMDETNNDTYKCLHTGDKNSKCSCPFAKVVNSKTMVIEDENNKTHSGIWLDIFPLDNVRDEKTFLKNRKKYARNYIMLRLSAVKKFIPRGISKIKNIMEFILYVPAKIMSNKYWAKKIQKIMIKDNLKDCDYVCRYCCASLKNIYPKDMFNDYIDVEFEKEHFRTIKEYDAYLTRLYGDYMTPPPKDKQVSGHSIKTYWLD